MRLLRVGLAATSFAVLTACSPPTQTTAVGLQELRREVVGSRMAFEKAASTLVPSSIVWASRTSVRYRLGADYRTENWEVAQIPPVIKTELLGFMNARNVSSIFVYHERVNFVMYAAGIAPSGVAVGVIVAPGDAHSCATVSTPVKVDGRGLSCERIEGQTYLYLDR